MLSNWIYLAATRRLHIGLVGIALAMVCGCAGVQWNFDYVKAQRQAASQNRPMLLYFWDWLSIDRSRMDSEVWGDPRVIAQSRHVIMVPLEQGWFGDVMRQYKVESAPTLVLLSPQGAEISRYKGVPTPEALVEWLQKGLSGAAPATAAASQ